MGKYIKSLGNPLQELLSPRHFVLILHEECGLRGHVHMTSALGEGEGGYLISLFLKEGKVVWIWH